MRLTDVRIKTNITAGSEGVMVKTTYDPDGNGKIDYNELENVGKRVFVQADAPTEANEGDIWFQIS